MTRQEQSTRAQASAVQEADPQTPLHIDFQAAEDDRTRVPLLWGQLNIWRPLQEMPEISSDLNIRRTVEPSEPVPLPVAIRAIRALIERHQALRTRFWTVGGQPCQEIACTGTYLVQRTKLATTDSSPVQDAVGQLAATGFDLEREWPMRIVLGCVDDQVHAVGLVASHVGVDGWAADTVAQELESLLRGVELPPVAWTPIEQARWESSERGRRRERRALEFWRQGLEAAPSSLFGPASEQAGPFPVRRWLISSAALAAAVQTLATRTETSTSTVLLAAASLALHTLAQSDTVALKLISSNRYASEQRSLTAPIAQDGLLLFTPSAADVQGTVRALHRPAMTSYMHATYSRDRLANVVSKVEGERGHPIDTSAYFNDARLERDWPEALLHELSAVDVGERMARTTIQELPALPSHDMRFLVTARYAPQSCELVFMADTRYIPADVCSQVPRGMEALLCAALTRDVRIEEVHQLLGVRAPSDVVVTDPGSTGGDR